MPDRTLDRTAFANRHQLPRVTDNVDDIIVRLLIARKASANPESAATLVFSASTSYCNWATVSSIVISVAPPQEVVPPILFLIFSGSANAYHSPPSTKSHNEMRKFCIRTLLPSVEPFTSSSSALHSFDSRCVTNDCAAMMTRKKILIDRKNLKCHFLCNSDLNIKNM